jgi:hypothetical protein
MTFLQENYTAPAQTGNYLKFKDWTIKFRILSDAITWWLDRDDKKPIRTKDKPESSIDPTRPAKHFRAFAVYNYDDKAIQICEVTQRSIQQAIMTLYKDEDFGDPKGYDIKVTRTWKELDTKYQVMWLNKSDQAPEITQKYLDAWIRLDALFDWWDPFKPF